MEDGAAQGHRGELYAALAAMGFGSAYVATSFALLDFEPVPAAVWRCVVATVIAGALVAAQRRRVASGIGLAPRRIGDTIAAVQPAAVDRTVRLLVLATLAGPVFLASMNLAVAHVGAAVAAFVAGLYAVLAAVIAPALLPERLTRWVLAGFALAFAGTALLGDLGRNGADAVGIGWGVLAAMSFALYLVLARRWSARYLLDGPTVALANVALTVVVLGGFALVVDPGSLIPAALPAQSVLAILWLGAVAALGPILTVASVRRIAAARTAAFLLLNPVTATILAALLLGQRPSPAQIAGGVLVLLGMAAATLPGGVGRGRTAQRILLD